MPTTDFLNVNALRSYPFLARTVGQPVDGPLTLNNLPTGVIVDAGFTAGPRSLFESDEHTVSLVRISRSGSSFTFEFDSDAPAIAGNRLIFSRDVTDELNSTEHLDSGVVGISDSGSDSELDACDDPLWSGYLTTGDLRLLDAFLSGDGEVLPGDVAVVVEPAEVVNLAGSYVTSFNLANADRTRYEAPSDCPEQSWPFPVGAIFIQSRCLTGELVLKAGHGVVIRQAASDNSLTVTAVVGAGEGPPCNEIPLFDAESAPAGSSLLSGGDRCNETLRSINGIGGPVLRLISSLGAAIVALPEENKLVIDLDMTGLATCYGSVSTVSETL